MADRTQAILKGITKAITDYGTIMGERNKLQSEILANELKQRSNFIWKMRERMQDPRFNLRAMQGMMSELYPEGDQQTGPVQGQMGAARPTRERLPAKGDLMQQFARTGGIAPGFPGALPAGAPQAMRQAQPQPDIFAQPVRPTVRMTATGYTPHYAPRKEFIYEQIQKKKRRGQTLTPKETKFEEDYLGTVEKEKLPTWAQQQKVESVKAGLRRGTGIITKEWGALAEEPVKSYADALRIIQFNKLDPADFEEELTFYKDIVQTGKAPDGRIVAKMQDGRMLYLDTREEIAE